ncbi:hypothetical protein PAXRUDRAFT_801751, partial [Paxillus rubicundulus Ve08.2h10]
MMSGSSQILHILFIIGVKPHVKYLRRILRRTQHTITMSPRFTSNRKHAIGYFKGTWQSLCGLHVRLDREVHTQYACLWIITCIHLHSFTLGHQKGINIQEITFFE